MLCHFCIVGLRLESHLLEFNLGYVAIFTRRAVQFNQDLVGFIGSTLTDEPSRTLWHCEKSEK